jgi:hypothetical protein
MWRRRHLLLAFYGPQTVTNSVLEWCPLAASASWGVSASVRKVTPPHVLLRFLGGTVSVPTHGFRNTCVFSLDWLRIPVPFRNQLRPVRSCLCQLPQTHKSWPAVISPMAKRALGL